ncbi:MAG TPA: hydroxyacylglutathione hydrolase, partial [Burkholderiales bacterium]|nr:hydroxyacylglutathione hydrolase [Burkholderiales bacterium]
RERYGVPVYGPATESIAAVTHPLREGDTVPLPSLGLNLKVMEIPGHTLGHIALVGDKLLFCGDTMFSAGCGRLFEGTPAQMFHSLSRLAALPETTAVYCGHEYTLSNLRFAQAVEPDNADIKTFTREVEALRTANQPTLPSNIGRERRINPFLRAAVPAVRAAAKKHAGNGLDDDVAVFAALRQWKDGFRG